MKIIITGAAGFIGSNLSKALINRGHNVIGIDNFDPYCPIGSRDRNLASFIENENFDYAFGQHSGVIDLNKDKLKERMWFISCTTSIV